MNLSKKKSLAAKTLGVGKSRIIFAHPRLEEIKEAITKQDIRDLHKEGAILVREVHGRKKVARKAKRASSGNIRKKMKPGKREYIIITRKLRSFLNEHGNSGLSREEIKNNRKKIKNRMFKNKNSLKEYLGGIKK